MAASNATDVSIVPRTASVTLPVETTTIGASNEGRGNLQTEINSALAYPYRLSSDFPDIPDIPSPLLRPPTAGQKTSLAVTSESSAHLPFSSAAGNTISGHVTQRLANPAGIESDRRPEDLDSMIRNQVGRQVDKVFSGAIKDLQGHLISKASEVDQLRVDLENMEQKEKDMFSGVSYKAGIPARTVSSSQYPSISSTYGGPLRPGGLGTRSVGYPVSGFGNIGTEFGFRESNAQIDDLKRKLKMTTELCAKQDAYYREVVSELENRLKETVAGRDHVLALREDEAAGQLQLIHQLEAGLRKQQQIIDAKDEGLTSMESSIKQLEDDLAGHKSFLDKIRRIALEEEKKRFRSGLVTSTLENNVSVGQIGDALIEILQKCLFDDDNEKKTLQSKLERVEAEFKSSREQTDNKQEEMQREHKARMSKLEKEHSQALDSSSNKGALLRKELESLQQETDKLREQHQTEMSAMDDKVKCLELEIEKTKKSSYETTLQFETKCKELEYSVRELTAELQVVKEEKQKLLTGVSQEQANVITLNEKLSTAEKLRQEGEKKNEELSKELTILKEKYSEEANSLRANVAEKETLIKDIREESTRLRETEVEKALNQEREKANARLDGILNELTKSNQNISTLKADLETKVLELSKQQEENVKMKNDLELRTKEMNLIREEKIRLAAELEKTHDEISNLRGQVQELTNSLEAKSKSLLDAENYIEKLQTQLNEREKTIASFQAQGTNLAEILERNSQTGDSLQREREQLIRTLEERIGEVEEMKGHREILAKKLRAKDKRVKELEEEKTSMTNSLKIKQEELDAMMEDRSNIMAELKLRQIEVTKLKDENGSLSSLVEGKHGEREKEITKLLSRLKGSEQDLALTRKLLKTKGDMSGKAVRVAGAMQQEVTAKRGELDALQSKIHWLTESLNTASKDARYYERRSSELSETVKQVTVDRDQLEFELRKTREQYDEYKKQFNHMEQALEKAALKHADSQGVIEKMEQEMARLKLKHSLEVKELERTSKTALSIRPEAASLVELLTKLNTGFRWPPLTTQANYNSVLVPQKSALPQPLQTLFPPSQDSQPEVTEMGTGQLTQSGPSREPIEISSKKNDEVTEDLKTLLHEVRSLITSFQAHVSQTVTPAKTPSTAFASQGPPAERALLDDGPVHPDDPDTRTNCQRNVAREVDPGKGHSGPISNDERHIDTKHRIAVQKERISRPKPVFSSEYKHEFDRDEASSVTTDLNSRLSTSYELDDVGDDVNDFAYPLHSSSPKKDSVASSDMPSEHLQPFDRPYSPLSSSIHSDHSDVTSLLIDQSTSTADTVISRDHLNAARTWKTSSASSVTSSQPSSSRMSDIAPLPRKHSRPVPQNLKVSKRDGDTDSARVSHVYRDQEEPTSKQLSQRTFATAKAPMKKTSSASEPVYRRAEMILQSLAQTGQQLTKKNREIEHLLKEQDRRIKKCRKNEDNIHALLS
ncbi:hypothetical protein ACROYT_G020177 [Oculina patagonica]